MYVCGYVCVCVCLSQFPVTVRREEAPIHPITWDTFHLPRPLSLPLFSFAPNVGDMRTRGRCAQRATVQSNALSMEWRGQGRQMAGGVVVLVCVRKDGVQSSSSQSVCESTVTQKWPQETKVCNTYPGLASSLCDWNIPLSFHHNHFLNNSYCS